MNIGLSEFIEELAMCGERILKFDLHAIARKGPIPPGRVAEANHEIVGVRELTFDLLA